MALVTMSMVSPRANHVQTTCKPRANRVISLPRHHMHNHMRPDVVDTNIAEGAGPPSHEPKTITHDSVSSHVTASLVT